MGWFQQAWQQAAFVVTQSPSGPAPKYLAFRSSKWFIMVAMSIAIFTDLFLYAVIVPVIPFALQTRAGVAPERTQYWVSVLLAVYGAALFAGAPICGILADYTSSRRVPFLLGLILLAAATAMLAVGDSIALLIAGRALQGLSAAMVWVVGLALLVDTVGKESIAEATGYVTIALSLALLLAPLLGGVVYAKAGYYAVYAMCFGLLGVDVVLRFALVEKKVARHWLVEETKKSTASVEKSEECKTEKRELEQHEAEERQLEKPESKERESEKEQATIQSAESTPPTTTILREEAANPTNSRFHLPRRMPVVLYLLGSPRMLAALYGTLVQAALITSFDSVVPLFVRETFHWDSIGAGLIFLPLVLASFFAPLVGYITDKRGPRAFATLGFLFACPFLILLRFIDHDSTGQKALLCALLFFIGLGLMMTLPPIMAEISYVVLAIEARKDAGFFGAQGAFARAYALFNMAFAAGCLVGPIWGGMVREAAGWGTMAWSLGLLSAVTSVPMVLLCGGLIWSARDQRIERERRQGHEDAVSVDEEKGTTQELRDQADPGFNSTTLLEPIESGGGRKDMGDG